MNQKILVPKPRILSVGFADQKIRDAYFSLATGTSEEQALRAKLDQAIEILKIDPRGLPQRMATAGPGKTLGEMSLIDGEPRFASCVTLESTLFAVLDREGLIRVVSEEPKIGVKILMELLMLLNQRLRSVSGDLMKCLDNKRLRLR